MDSYKDADIQVNISTNSVEESNLFLRKLYDEISKSIKIGWMYQPVKKDCVIRVGDSSFGTMWLDYKIKGQINNVYILTKDMKTHNIVKAAIQCAKENFQNRRHYFISAKITETNFPFVSICKDNIKIESRLNKENKYDNNIYFTIQAFGKFDLKYILTQKMNHLQHLLCAYTNKCFTVMSYAVVGDEDIDLTENNWYDYDVNWIDDCFVEMDGIKHISLNPEFFKLFRLVLLNDQYEETIRLILNAAQEIYCSKMLIENYHENPQMLIPGCTDIVNTMMISTLEPLSNIGASKPETCKQCGNLKYKIRHKVMDLCREYMDEPMVKYIFDSQYGLRSSFLHEGNSTTNQFYTGTCVPLINPISKNEMMAACTYIYYNLFDWVSYIFRRKVENIIKEE